MKLIEQLKAKVTSVFRNSAKSGAITLNRLNELFGVGGYCGAEPDLSEITYYTCLKVLSETLGKLPCHIVDGAKRRVKDHEVNYALSVKPNGYQTPSQFFSYLEYCRNHFGNAYAYVSRSPRGELEELLPLEPRRVTLWVNTTEEMTRRRFYYKYVDINGKQYYIRPEEILHVKTWLTDESKLMGRSVREILATSLVGAKASHAFLNDMYRHGLLARAVIKYVGDLKPSSQEALLNRLEEQANTNGRRMIALPVGFDISPLDLKLSDAQFMDIRQYSNLQIAAAFGIKPNYLNDYSKSSYANSVSQNLSFYTDSLLPIVTNYEQEMRAKLLTRDEQRDGLKVKFNVNVILRPDPSAQAEILAKLVGIGLYGLDEARAWLDMPPYEGEMGKTAIIMGKTAIINGAYKRLEEVMKDAEGEK